MIYGDRPAPPIDRRRRRQITAAAVAVWLAAFGAATASGPASELVPTSTDTERTSP